MSLFSFLAKEAVETAADVAVPGLGTIGGKVWDMIKPILPWLIIAAAVMGFHFWDKARGERAAVTKATSAYDAKMKVATARMIRARTVLAGADALMVRQSQSIRQHAALATAAIARSEKLEIEARKKDAGYAARIDKLSHAHVDGPPCPSVSEVEEDWK